MKWLSTVSLLVAGLVLAMVSQRVAASPAIRMGGPDVALTPIENLPSVEALLAVLTDSSAPDISLAYQVGRLNALKAMSLSGLGGIGEMTACQIDAVDGIAL